MHRLLKLSVSLCLLLLLGMAIMPAVAQDCLPAFGTGADETFNCAGPNGVHTGSGTDTVNITGDVTGQIASSGGHLIVIVLPDGSLVAPGMAIEMTGDGDITSTGNVTGDLWGIYLYGNGDVTSTGNVTGTGQVGIQLVGDGSITSTGTVTGGFGGLYLFGDGAITNHGNVTGTAGTGILIVDGTGVIDSTGNITATDGIHIANFDWVNNVAYAAGTIHSVGNVTGSTSNGIFIEQDGSITSTGDVTGNFNGIQVGGNGSITSIGNVTANLLGIFLGGDGNIVSTGDITSGTNGIYLTGTGNIVSTGNISSNGGISHYGNGDIQTTGNIITGLVGIQQLGAGNITSIGNVTSDRLGLYMGGNGSINSTGDVTGTELYGILLVGNGYIISTGNVSGGADGIYLLGGGAITSIGDVISTAATGISIKGNGDVTSTGNVTGSDEGIRVLGNGSITSTGDVTGTEYNGLALFGDGSITSTGNVTGGHGGIFLGGDGSITSAGNVTGGYQGIYLDGNGNIQVTSGTVTATRSDIYGEGVGIQGGSGAQNVVIASVVDGVRAAVDLDEGNDQLTLTETADVRNDILMGGGDDIVQLMSGATVDGVIDGGELAETTGDRLIVGSQAFCDDVPADIVFVAEQQAMLAGLDINDGVATFVSEGQTYTAAYFEQIASGLWLRSCFPKAIEDGRVNGYSLAAPAAGYCNVEHGINLWAIDADGVGTLDVSVSGSTMDAALELAVSSGTHQLVIEGTLGTSLWALSSNEFQFNRVSPIDGKLYEFMFTPDTCQS